MLISRSVIELYPLPLKLPKIIFLFFNPTICRLANDTHLSQQLWTRLQLRRANLKLRGSKRLKNFGSNIQNVGNGNKNISLSGKNLWCFSAQVFSVLSLNEGVVGGGRFLQLKVFHYRPPCRVACPKIHHRGSYLTRHCLRNRIPRSVMGWSRPRLQTCQLSPRAGRPKGLVELSAVLVWTNP